MIDYYLLMTLTTRTAAITLGKSAVDGAPVYGILLRRAHEADGLVTVGSRVLAGRNSTPARVVRIGKVVKLKSRRIALAIAVSIIEHGRCAYCGNAYEIVDAKRRAVCPSCDTAPLTGAEEEGDAGDRIRTGSREG